MKLKEHDSKMGNIVNLSIQMTEDQFKKLKDAFNDIISDAITGNDYFNPIFSDDCTTERDNLTGNHNSKDQNTYWPSCTACGHGNEGKSAFDSQLKLVSTFLEYFDMKDGVPLHGPYIGVKNEKE